MEPRLIDRASLVDRATAALREEILAGVLPPDTPIHLSATADRLGVSPIPVREALRILASEGLVEQVPQRGFRVRAVTLSDLEDTYRLRAVLDPLAARLAVPNLIDDDLQHLEQTLAAMGEANAAGHYAELRRLHRQFHFGIYQAAQSPWLVRFLSMLWDNGERYWIPSVHHEAGHRRILRACAARDAARVEALVREHREESRQAVEQRLKQLRNASPSALAQTRVRGKAAGRAVGPANKRGSAADS
jgi:DNA-binding GntR family transcriptional regulator